MGEDTMALAFASAVARPRLSVCLVVNVGSNPIKPSQPARPRASCERAGPCVCVLDVVARDVTSLMFYGYGRDRKCGEDGRLGDVWRICDFQVVSS